MSTEMGQKKSQLIVIFVTVFLYLVGFGLVIPIIPVLAKDFGASPLQVGLLLSVYSLMQFLFAPFWGRLSDRFGRRPILLFCLLGEVVAYVGFSMARSFEALFLARLFAGFFGASISTASAYISDITPLHERSRGMALIGAAFGLGFLTGPALGGLLSVWGTHISPEPHFGTSFAALWVAGLCLVNFLFGFKFLKESLSDENRQKALTELKRNRFEVLFRFIKMPVVGPLVGVFFLSSLAMATMEATLVLFVKERFNWGIEEISFGFAYIGFVMVMSQGLLVRRLLPKVGERRMLLMGLALAAFGFLTIALSSQIWILAVSQTFLALGMSFTNPSVMGSISLLAPAEEQGAAMGTTQGTASLGRIIGPAFGGWVFGAIGIMSPFIFSSSLALLGLAIVVLIFAKLPEAGKKKMEVAPVGSQALPIGYFQIDNLIRTHVPFLFITTGIKLPLVFETREQVHLEQQLNRVAVMTIESVKALLSDKKSAKDAPIVLLCQAGHESKLVAEQLGIVGYTNVYYVLDGVAGLQP